jgi:undecaprenyl phosphate-alpha-L-ara4N flippase subunit ArnE
MQKIHSYLLVICTIFIIAGSQILLKKVLNKLNREITIIEIFKLLKNLSFLGAVFGVGISTVIYIYSLQTIELSMAYSIYSLIYVVSMFFSKYFLNEPIEKKQWIGVFLITLGVALSVQT